MPETDTTTTMTPSMSAMLVILSAERGETVARLAERAELGRSTTGKVLTGLEGLGLARRQSAERTDGRRAPDLWFAAQPDATEQGHSEDAQPEPTGTATTDRLDNPADASQGEPATAATHTAEAPDADAPDADAETVVQDTTDAELAREADKVPAEPDPAPESDAADEREHQRENQLGEPEATQRAGTDDSQPVPDDTDPADTAAPTGDAPAAPEPEAEAAAPRRLAKGELEAMVADYLAAHPDEEFTSSKVGKALGRSGGAVANNFDKLLAKNRVELTCEEPRRVRYRATQAGA